MNILKSPIFWIIAVVVIIGGALMSYYNNFVVLNESIDGQWAQVEVQYQRRFDLIPNLVESVKAVLAQEKDVFGAIADARTRYGGAATVDEKVAAASQMESALGRLLVVMENYPQLRSTENVSQLTDELAGTENRVSVERRRFNELVLNYNIAIKRFPGNLLAGMFGFGARELFQSAPEAATAPKVQF